MDAMVFAGQNDVPVLQEDDPARQPEVRVRPLVDLVGEGAKDDQAEDKALPGVQLLQGFCRAGRGWVSTGPRELSRRVGARCQPGPHPLPLGSKLPGAAGTLASS